jgi:hypothetical protein
MRHLDPVSDGDFRTFADRSARDGIATAAPDANTHLNAHIVPYGDADG